jgi:hypothetical protein
VSRLLNRFLRDSSLNVSVVPNNGSKTSVNYVPAGDSEDPMVGVQVAAAYADVVKDVVTHATLLIGGVYAACQIVKRLCR